MSLDADATESKGGFAAGAIGTIIEVGVVLVLVLQNRQDVTFNFLVWSRH